MNNSGVSEANRSSEPYSGKVWDNVNALEERLLASQRMLQELCESLKIESALFSDSTDKTEKERKSPICEASTKKDNSVSPPTLSPNNDVLSEIQDSRDIVFEEPETCTSSPPILTTDPVILQLIPGVIVEGNKEQSTTNSCNSCSINSKCQLCQQIKSLPYDGVCNECYHTPRQIADPMIADVENGHPDEVYPKLGTSAFCLICRRNSQYSYGVCRRCYRKERKRKNDGDYENWKECARCLNTKLLLFGRIYCKNCYSNIYNQKENKQHLIDTQRNSASLSPSSFRSPFTSTDDEMKGCLCRDKREGKTINCDNSRCPIGWFHERCVTDKIEEGKKWYCKICRNKENSTELRFVYRLLNDSESFSTNMTKRTGDVPIDSTPNVSTCHVDKSQENIDVVVIDSDEDEPETSTSPVNSSDKDKQIPNEMSSEPPVKKSKKQKKSTLNDDEIMIITEEEFAVSSNGQTKTKVNIRPRTRYRPQVDVKESDIVEVDSGDENSKAKYYA